MRILIADVPRLQCQGIRLPSGGGEATAINHLHKVEEIVQVKHGRVVHLIGR